MVLGLETIMAGKYSIATTKSFSSACMAVENFGSISFSKMFSYISHVSLLIGLFGSYAVEGAPRQPEADMCGCLGWCDEQYNTPLTKEDIEEREACRRGCELHHLIVRSPTNIAIYEKVATKAMQQCFKSCTEGLPDEKRFQIACTTGCSSGCELIIHTRPRVKVTILVEEEAPNGADGIELDQILTDPALQKQLEASLSSQGSSNIKIPASYFTNLPIIREHDKKPCFPEPRFCDGWLPGEPILCAALVILAAGLLLAAYCRKGAPRETPEHKSMLPEKVPLQLDV